MDKERNEVMDEAIKKLEKLKETIGSYDIDYWWVEEEINCIINIIKNNHGQSNE